MPPRLVLVDPEVFPSEPMPCLRCGREAPMRVAGPCAECASELREQLRGEARDIGETDYVPNMNVTPNAVALKD